MAPLYFRFAFPARDLAEVEAKETSVTTFADKTLTCRDCGIEFTFTAGEQDFYLTKGLTNEPGRCPECRQLRREGRAITRVRTLHQVTCAVCGSLTEVPFVPTQNRPVYCADCFSQIRSRN
jgi:CxxC-x17-CxxC domain-containing protein